MEKTGQCKACGNLVSKKAKFCPHCGQSKPYKQSSTKLWVLLILITLVILINCDGTEETTSHAPNPIISNNATKIEPEPSNEEPIFTKDEIWTIQKWAERKDPDALYLLAYAYSDNDYGYNTRSTGVKRDRTLSNMLYQDAADLGNEHAQFTLSLLYSLGKGVPKDEYKAFDLLKKAASHGDPMYQARLAGRYAEGDGTIKNDEFASKLYLKSAEQGFGIAQAILATRYRLGRGVPKNNIQAYKWHTLAKMTGHNGGFPTGFRNLSFDDLLAEEMGDDDIREAQFLINQWLSQHPHFPKKYYDDSYKSSTTDALKRIIEKEKASHINKKEYLESPIRLKQGTPISADDYLSQPRE